jgi:hypothetical protein
MRALLALCLLALAGCSLGTTVATPASNGTWAVAYAATPPNGATGTSQGQRDRTQAHMEAARACAARAGAHCRPLAEAGPGECLAIAQAGRVTGLVRTSDPRTFQVTLVEYGKGTDAATANRAAYSVSMSSNSAIADMDEIKINKANVCFIVYFYLKF